MSRRTPEPWREQADALCELLVARLPTLVGVYLHGSAVLGGFTEASDLDMLVVAEDEPGPDVAPLAEEILRISDGRRPLELSVVRRGDAARPAPPWPFVLHVNSGEHRYVLGGPGDDPDLAAHYAVVRAAGLALVGPEAVSVVGVVDRDVLLDHLVDELEWGVRGADQRYAVLNACRAVAYAERRALLSKIAGGHRWLAHVGRSSVVDSALEAQRTGADLGRCSDEARNFIDEARARLRRGSARE